MIVNMIKYNHPHTDFILINVNSYKDFSGIQEDRYLQDVAKSIQYRPSHRMVDKLYYHYTVIVAEDVGDAR